MRGGSAFGLPLPHPPSAPAPSACAFPGRLNRRVHIADAQIPLKILLISTYVFAHASVDSLHSLYSDCTLHHQPFSPGGLNCSGLEHFSRNLSLSCGHQAWGKPLPLYEGHKPGEKEGPGRCLRAHQRGSAPSAQGMSLCPAGLHCSQETSLPRQDRCTVPL